MKITQLTPEAAILEELGQRLVRMRKNKDLTQPALADKAGIGESTLRRIENGQDSQFETWLKVLRALNMIEVIDTLLPETIRSPMADVKGATQKSKSKGGDRPVWGDESS